MSLEIPRGYMESLVKYLGDSETPIKGHVAVVINSIQGVGPRIVTALAQEGVEVIGTYTAGEEEAESLKKAVEQMSGSIKFVSGDMRAPKDIQRLETIVKESAEGKPVTLIVNGTGASALIDRLGQYINGGKIVIVEERSWFGAVTEV